MFRPIKILHYLAFMELRGYSAESVLAGSGLSKTLLLNPSCLIDLDQAKTIVSNMIEISGDQAIGLQVGHQTEMVDLGLVGHAMMSARSVREAVSFWCQYSETLVGMLIRMQSVESGPDNWSLSITETAPLGYLYNFCAEEMLVITEKLGSLLIGDKLSISRLDLSFPAPSHQALYERYFNAPIHFNARSTTLHFRGPHLDRPLRNNDLEFNALCARQCDLVMRQVGGTSAYASRVRRRLLRTPGEIPTIEEVAQQLNISSRTLRRHLHDEGLTYQQIVNDFRSDLAKEHLRSGYLPPKEIAYLLGFQDPNTFRRAFKLWTGLTIQQFRNSLPS